MECFHKHTHKLYYGFLLLALSFFVFISSPVQADFYQDKATNFHSNEITLHSKRTKQQVNQYVRILEDQNNSLAIEDIIHLDKEKQFEQAPESNTLNIGYSQSAYWLAINVKNGSNEVHSEWWYQLDLPLLDLSEFYMAHNGSSQQNKLVRKHLSYDTPLSKREVNHVTQVYRFTLSPGEKATIYIKIKSDFSIHLPLYIYTPAGFVESVAIEELLYGGFMGAILILIAYNLFMFISVREKTFLYYISYMASYLIFLVTERVHGISLIGDIPDFFHKENLAYYIWISWLFALVLARSFLETKEHEPDLDAIIKLFIALATISIIVTPILDITTTIQWAVLCTIPFAILMVWVAYIAMVRGNPVAHFYFTAWFLNFGGVAVYAFTVTGKLPFNFVTSNSPHFGIICQMVIISFALADRIKVAQRKASDASQESLVNLKRYRSLFNNAVEGIFQISLNRQFIDINQAMASMLGFHSPKNLIRNTHDALNICYPRSEDLLKVVRRIESGEDIHELEARYTGHEGETRWATSSIRIIYDQDNNPSHLEGTFVDITERVERVNDRLKKDVAEASAAAKSRFLANMSHEIRTPLTAIIGYGENLLDSNISENERRESSEIVIKSGKHLLELVNDILDHSKIDADKMTIEKITTQLFPLFNEIRTYFEPKAIEKGIDFNIHYDFPLPEKIQTDPTRLKQILINLCSNALKFTETGSITMAVCCNSADQKLAITVSDTGVGVKEEQLDKLFDPFAQASPSVARQHGGTGLGLSISKRLSEMLGGTINAASVYGEGSHFEVVISTGKLENVKFIRNRSELATQNNSQDNIDIPFLKGKILYAEDNELNCRLVTKLVSATGASITTVNNGAKALELVTRNDESFDLILMDIQMPIMDGRDATVAIREAGNNTPIIAVTANVMAQDVAEYKDAGCTEILPKPIERQAFYDVLKRYLQAAEVKEAKPKKLELNAIKHSKHSSKTNKPKTRDISGTVLVAEDNVVNSRLISLYLTKIGVNIILAEDGKQAVQKAMDNPIDLIIMDQHMPEIEGPEAIERLRKEGFEKPILAFTASDDIKDRTLMMDAGCNGTIDKPIKFDQLYQALSEYLPLASKVKQNTNSLWNDPELRPIVRQFVKDIPKLMISMDKAFKDHDWMTLRGLAHQVIGSAGSLGFSDITISAKRVERALKKDEIKGLKNIFESFKHEAEKAHTNFKQAL